MKAYTNYIVALFIGLLSFNTLSACVHTRQALGVDFNNSFPNQDCSSCCSRICGCFSFKKKLCFAVVGACLIWFLTSSIGNHGMVPNTNNGRNLTTFGPSILPNGETTTFPYSMTPEEAESITKAIEGKEEWNSTTTEKPSTTTTKKPSKKPSTTTTSTTTVATTTTERLSGTTTQKPDDDVPAVKDPMVLDDDILLYIRKNMYSKESVEKLFKKDVKVNAKDKKNETLLMKAVRSGNMALIKFILAKGADVNAQNDEKMTSLHISIQEVYQPIPGVEDIIGEPIIRLLIEHGADPCIKDKKGRNAQSYAEGKDSRIIAMLDVAIEKLHPDTKQCPEEA